jgi:hypothetical protein
MQTLQAVLPISDLCLDHLRQMMANPAEGSLQELKKTQKWRVGDGLSDSSVE